MGNYASNQWLMRDYMQWLMQWLMGNYAMANGSYARNQWLMGNYAMANGKLCKQSMANGKLGKL